MKVTIVFEVADCAPSDFGAHFKATTLHEALCKDIYESDGLESEHWRWLKRYVDDIELVASDKEDK